MAQIRETQPSSGPVLKSVGEQIAEYSKTHDFPHSFRDFYLIRDKKIEVRKELGSSQTDENRKRVNDHARTLLILEAMGKNGH